MEKKQRKANRTPEQIRAEYEAKRTHHLEQAEQWAAKIAKLDEPKKPRMIIRKPSMTSVLKAAKSDFSAEEMLAIVEAAKRRKMEMGTI